MALAQRWIKRDQYGIKHKRFYPKNSVDKMSDCPKGRTINRYPLARDVIFLNHSSCMAPSLHTLNDPTFFQVRLLIPQWASVSGRYNSTQMPLPEASYILFIGLKSREYVCQSTLVMYSISSNTLMWPSVNIHKNKICINSS